jgi:hypothetical protein
MKKHLIDFGNFNTGRHCRNLRQWLAIAVIAVASTGFSTVSYGQEKCADVFKDVALSAAITHSSFDDVVAVMNRRPYDVGNLPVIPLQMFKWLGNRLSFLVAKRSKEILIDKRDYREVGLEKPIHPMGVGLTGKLVMKPTRWSGLFRGGEYLVAARASISQGNPFKIQADGRAQLRSTAMAVKVFGTPADRGLDVRTANAVFQNNLNGLLGSNGEPLNYLESTQTNQPGIDFSKVNQAYQWETLLGVAYGSVMNRKDHMSKVPFINPQIRPVHSWSEFSETDPRTVKTPTWVMLKPVLTNMPLNESDFRLEITKTLERDGQLKYELFAADQQDSRGKIQWESVGSMIFDHSILSEGVDKNLLFPHDSLNSGFTGLKFAIPQPMKQFDSVADDLQ